MITQAAELDKLLGGACTHHREIEGNETQRFLDIMDQVHSIEDEAPGDSLTASKGFRASADQQQQAGFLKLDPFDHPWCLGQL